MNNLLAGVLTAGGGTGVDCIVEIHDCGNDLRITDNCRSSIQLPE